MNRRILIFLMFTILLTPQCFAFASLEISEVMYDLKTGGDTGREWIEVYNNGTDTVDTSTLRLFEGGTNHKLKLIQGDAKISAQGYAVIVSDANKFKTDWPNFSGTMLDSTFSLSNSGEGLAMKDGDSTLDEYTYNSGNGGAGDGNSLQKINGAWVGAKPTPGAENKITFIPKPAPLVTEKNNLAATKIREEEVSKDNEVEVATQTPVPDSYTETSPDVVKENNTSFIFIIIFIFLLGVGGGAIYFIRKRGKVPQNGEDFEILDK